MSSTRSIRIPAYRLHKPSGQGVVTLDGKDHYLGKWGTDASKEAYHRFVGQWQANGRYAPREAEHQVDLTIAELIVRYWGHAEAYYRKNGKPTSELACTRDSLRSLRQLYGRTPACDFGPLALKVCRESMIEAGLARSTINGRVGRIKRMFKWATETELVPPGVFQGLQAIAGLRRGRAAARETEPVRPVPEEHVTAVFPFVSAQVRAMIELQLLTGMRPGEVRHMRGVRLGYHGEDLGVHSGKPQDRAPWDRAAHLSRSASSGDSTAVPDARPGCIPV